MAAHFSLAIKTPSQYFSYCWLNHSRAYYYSHKSAWTQL